MPTQSQIQTCNEFAAASARWYAESQRDLAIGCVHNAAAAQSYARECAAEALRLRIDMLTQAKPMTTEIRNCYRLSSSLAWEVHCSNCTRDQATAVRETILDTHYGYTPTATIEEIGDAFVIHVSKSLSCD